jgi:hypothetical protein
MKDSKAFEPPAGGSGGRSRREVLKRGGALGVGTMLWTTPLVQHIAMTPASAQTASGLPTTTTPTTASPGAGAQAQQQAQQQLHQQTPVSLQTPQVAGEIVSRPAGPIVLANDGGGQGATLPVTGSDLLGLGAAGVGAIGTGMALVRAAERRRKAPEGPSNADEA